MIHSSFQPVTLKYIRSFGGIRDCRTLIRFRRECRFARCLYHHVADKLREHLLADCLLRLRERQGASLIQDSLLDAARDKLFKSGIAFQPGTT